jgi:hypothetical protein
MLNRGLLAQFSFNGLINGMLLRWQQDRFSWALYGCSMLWTLE